MHELIVLLAFSLLLISCSKEQSEALSPTELIDLYEGWSSNEDGGSFGNHSEDYLEERELFLDSLQKRFSTDKTKDLSITDQASIDLLNLITAHELYELKFQSQLSPLNSEGGFLTDILYRTRSQRVETENEWEEYQIFLREIPEFFAERQKNMERGMEANKMMPHVVIDHCIEAADKVLRGKTDASFFLSPVAHNEQWSEDVKIILQEELLPAYRGVKEFLSTEYRSAAPAKIGLSEMTDGKEYYEQLVRFYSTFEINPEEVYEIGLEEVSRIRSEMDQIIKELEYQGSYQDFLQFLRTSDQFYAETPEELLQYAAWITNQVQGQLPRYFGKLPRVPLTVVPVPDALASNYTSGRYSPGSHRQEKAGEFWVNTYDLKSRPKFVLPALALHEGVPGHHTQIMLANELEDLPDFRKSTYLSAFGEGWSLYTEYLGKEMGIYDDAYTDFGRLTYEMWRACRLVVDPGMHYMGWDRERALKFMSENTALSVREVNSEIDRYIGWPGQAISYKMGELKIRELRKECEQALGEDFDIRSFHDLLLSQGSVPLMTLETMVDNYISAQ